jgi:hypothetical protein
MTWVYDGGEDEETMDVTPGSMSCRNVIESLRAQTAGE